MTNWNWIKFGAGFLLFFSAGFTPKTHQVFWVLPRWTVIWHVNVSVCLTYLYAGMLSLSPPVWWLPWTDLWKLWSMHWISGVGWLRGIMPKWLLYRWAGKAVYSVWSYVSGVSWPNCGWLHIMPWLQALWWPGGSHSRFSCKRCHWMLSLELALMSC